jgi:hypothetical protein
LRLCNVVSLITLLYNTFFVWFNYGHKLQNMYQASSIFPKKKPKNLCWILILEATEGSLNCNSHLVSYCFAYNYDIGDWLLCLLTLNLFRIGYSGIFLNIVSVSFKICAFSFSSEHNSSIFLIEELRVVNENVNW